MVSGHIRYSIAEEMKKGSLIGNVAQDLGLDLKRLRSGRARIVTGENIQYAELKTDKGVLVVNERIDREQLCGDVTPCSFSFELILENPMELHQITILIQDQNDNPPQVLYPVQTGGSLVAEMVPRSADVGYLVSKVVAVDVDSGQNAWLSYKLQKATDRALFEVGLQNGEIRTIRQVSDKDAVKQRLAVIVEDNGQPSRSATVIVNVAVADSFPEVLSEFTDFPLDKEYNDNLTFYLVLALAVVSFLFITCLVVIISVKIYRWRQSRILYHSGLPVIPYYPPRYSDTLGTGTLPHVYNYEVCRTTDSRKSDCKFGTAGSQNVLIMNPSSTGTMQRMQSEKNILDEADSPREIRYSIPEEMKKGSHIGNVAQDLGLDLKRLRSGRARIVTGENIQYAELKTDKGILVVKDRIDREQLCGDVTPCSFSFEIILENPMELHHITIEVVKILIQDQNDNPPQVLYPVQTGGSLVAEMVPRSADVGYLVSKVVAVDVDSGQNAWLSYKLQKATDRALFEVGLQNGEIRTIRQVSDKDAVKQRLAVIVEDNGQPSRSATVIVNVAVADSFPEVLSEFTDFPHDKEYNDNLTFYLVLALAVVSFLFITCLVVIISVKIYRWRQSRILYHSGLPVIPYYPPRYSDTLGTGTLPHVYNYEVCRTTDSGKSDCKFGTAGSQNVLIMDPSSTGTMQRIQSEKSILAEADSPLEIRYSIPEEMKKGSHIGNVAQDLGLDLKRLRSGRARIVTGENIQYAELKTDKGVLVVKDRIDREQLCGDVTPCSFSFEMILENPIELHRITILIQDQNDNPPQVLYPVQTGGSLVAEMVPRSADVGYLVSKVVAVDVDSGQNAWLSYKLQKATDRALFEVGLQNGEIRTIRQVSDKDAVKQRLAVIVEDNGQPSRSATVIVNVAVADSFPEVLSEFTDFPHDKEYNDNLTFYLVLALAVVSFLFITCLVVIISVKIYRWRQSRILYHSGLPVIPYYPPRYSDTLGTGTLPHVYNYEVCRTTDSRKSDVNYVHPKGQSLISVDGDGTDTPQGLSEAVQSLSVTIHGAATIMVSY
ncbi:protocadherin beta-16-like [Brachionichthys hirsutus]|uniref:protocadherin beta-16-like n=1 Tax=Brachionichthys hirsutus TaxID=412623 RepID=UPI0036046814